MTDRKISIDDFDLDSDISVAFYNSSNYENLEAAEKESAGYRVCSSISMYGSTGIFDLQELVSKLLECIGREDEFSCVIAARDGRYIDLDKVIECCG